MAKKIVKWILFAVLFSLLSLLIIFYLDLANGPMWILFVELAAIIALIVLSILIPKKFKLVRFASVLGFVIVTAVMFILAKPTVEKTKAVKDKNPEKTEVLTLANGKVQGVYNSNKTVEVYAGIPYAKAPVGELRWKEQQDVENWEGVRDCSTFAPKSMQAKENSVFNTIKDIYAEGGWHPDFNMYPLEEASEDSLYLNIWKPAGKTNLPILVYIHGGSLTSGSASDFNINGETFALNDVIMITVAYRLGVFGYFAHEDLISESPNNTTGNYGLLDQIKALKWVNDNAAYFGGDKNNITIAGESAGSSSISAICSSPLASGLFKRAIGESSSLVVKTPPHTYRPLNNALKMGENIMKEFGCKTIDELRKIPAEKLVKTKFTNSQMTLDGYALTKNPYDVYVAHENNEEALLNGYNVKEADPFVIPTTLLSPVTKKNIESKLTEVFGAKYASQMVELYKDMINKKASKAFNEIISVYWFIFPHESWSNMALAAGDTVYRYQFTKENGFYGTYHFGEVIYAYGNISKSNKQFAYKDEDRLLSQIMVKYWTNFIKTGNPNGEGLPTWSTYNGVDKKVMELGTNVGMFTDKYTKLYKILNDFMDKK